jgi:hypothetical protein
MTYSSSRTFNSFEKNSKTLNSHNLVIFVSNKRILINKGMKFIVSLTLLFFTWWTFIPLLAIAQEKENDLHSSDNPHKYNSSFEGIGPIVYILPPLKTEEELLVEQYVIKKQNHHQIDSLIININFEKELKKINTPHLSSSLEDSLKDGNEESHLIAIINYYKNEMNEDYYADWQNNLAIFYLLSGESNKANALFLESLKIKEKLGSIEDQLLVMNNLALLEAKTGNNTKAMSLYDQLLEQAKKAKNLNNQTESYLAIAKLEAQSGNFSEAHNLIIKKSMPLLQKSKNYQGIVIALNNLASFKEMQKKDTEAKWIYLQAVDVARKHNDEKGLAISFYNLAQLKNRIGDGNLSIADFIASKNLAIKNEMEDLLVEIQDGLGDAYLKLNDYKAAALALNEYQSLKTSLLNQYLNSKN